MNMLPMATCLDVELLIKHASFNILEEGDILKLLTLNLPLTIKAREASVRFHIRTEFDSSIIPPACQHCQCSRTLFENQL